MTFDLLSEIFQLVYLQLYDMIFSCFRWVHTFTSIAMFVGNSSLLSLCEGVHTGHQWIPITNGQYYGTLIFPVMFAVQAVEQTIALLVIGDVLSLMWYQCNVHLLLSAYFFYLCLMAWHCHVLLGFVFLTFTTWEHWFKVIDLKLTRPSLVQRMARCLLGTKPLSEPMLDYCSLDPCQQISVK